MRVTCNSDFGEYSTILDDLDRVVRAIRCKKVAADKQFVAKTLKINLKSLFDLVKSHVMQGNSGVALVLYQELSGLAGSSMFRRISKTLRDSVGKSRGGRGAFSGNDYSGFTARYQGTFQSGRGRGSGGGVNRGKPALQQYGYQQYRRGDRDSRDAPANIRCYTCLEWGHGFQQCPKAPNSEGNQ